MKLDWLKKCCFALVLPAIFFLGEEVFAATLDSLYKPLLEKGRFLYQAEAEYFSMQEQGQHAAPIYGNFTSRPYFTSIANQLNFGINEKLELALGITQALPDDYDRRIYAPDGSLSVTQEYDLENFWEYFAGLRLRLEPLELYFDFIEKRQKTSWKVIPVGVSANYFSYIRAHYEDFSGGARYVSAQNSNAGLSNFSLLFRPLLEPRQYSLDLKLRFRKAALRMNAYNFATSTFTNFYQRLSPHFSPGINLAYGLSEKVEVAGGLTFDSPFKSAYEYRDTLAGGIDLLVANYKLDRNFQLPLKIRYRPKDNFECALSADSAFAHQELNYYRRDAATGAITDFAARKLSYFNTQPSLTLTWLYENQKKLEPQGFQRLTRVFLKQGQCLLDFTYQKDITTLDKHSDNGPLNKIDPYNLYLYPLDFFVAGSEYSVFYTGNSSRTASNVLPQNWYLLSLGLTYGLSDNFNAGLKAGYHSASSLHHFTAGNPNQSYDLTTRFYKFKPYYFFNFFCDWRLSDNSMISFATYFVPEYKTILQISGLAKEFNEDAEYYRISLRYKLLF